MKVKNYTVSGPWMDSSTSQFLSESQGNGRVRSQSVEIEFEKQTDLEDIQKRLGIGRSSSDVSVTTNSLYSKVMKMKRGVTPIHETAYTQPKAVESVVVPFKNTARVSYTPSRIERTYESRDDISYSFRRDPAAIRDHSPRHSTSRARSESPRRFASSHGRASPTRSSSPARDAELYPRAMARRQQQAAFASGSLATLPPKSRPVGDSLALLQRRDQQEKSLRVALEVARHRDDQSTNSDTVSRLRIRLAEARASRGRSYSPVRSRDVHPPRTEPRDHIFPSTFQAGSSKPLVAPAYSPVSRVNSASQSKFFPSTIDHPGSTLDAFFDSIKPNEPALGGTNVFTTKAPVASAYAATSRSAMDDESTVYIKPVSVEAAPQSVEVSAPLVIDMTEVSTVEPSTPVHAEQSPSFLRALFKPFTSSPTADNNDETTEAQPATEPVKMLNVPEVIDLSAWVNNEEDAPKDASKQSEEVIVVEEPLASPVAQSEPADVSSTKEESFDVAPEAAAADTDKKSEGPGVMSKLTSAASSFLKKREEWRKSKILDLQREAQAIKMDAHKLADDFTMGLVKLPPTPRANDVAPATEASTTESSEEKLVASATEEAKEASTTTDEATEGPIDSAAPEEKEAISTEPAAPSSKSTRDIIFVESASQDGEDPKISITKDEAPTSAAYTESEAPADEEPAASDDSTPEAPASSSPRDPPSPERTSAPTQKNPLPLVHDIDTTNSLIEEEMFVGDPGNRLGSMLEPQSASTQPRFSRSKRVHKRVVIMSPKFAKQVNSTRAPGFSMDLNMSDADDSTASESSDDGQVSRVERKAIQKKTIDVVLGKRQVGYRRGDSTVDDGTSGASDSYAHTSYASLAESADSDLENTYGEYGLNGIAKMLDKGCAWVEAQSENLGCGAIEDRRSSLLDATTGRETLSPRSAECQVKQAILRTSMLQDLTPQNLIAGLQKKNEPSGKKKVYTTELKARNNNRRYDESTTTGSSESRTSESSSYGESTTGTDKKQQQVTLLAQRLAMYHRKKSTNGTPKTKPSTYSRRYKQSHLEVDTSDDSGTGECHDPSPYKKEKYPLVAPDPNVEDDEERRAALALAERLRLRATALKQRRQGRRDP